MLTLIVRDLKLIVGSKILALALSTFSSVDHK